MTMPMTMGPGMSMAVPDVCMTPPFAIPAPFPNAAMNATAVPAYYTIMINMQPELNMGGMCATSSGDEGGSMGGVASGIFMGPCRPVMGSTCYYVGGMPSWLLTRPTLQNMTNSPGISQVPSQTCKQVLR